MKFPFTKNVQILLLAAFLTTALVTLPATYASADDDLSDSHEFSSTLSIVLDEFNDFADKVVDICDDHCDDIANEVGDALDRAENALNVLNGEPLVLDQDIIDSIREDTAALQNIDTNPPEYSFLSEDRVAIINRGVLDNTLSDEYDDFTEERDAYIEQLDEWRGKLADAAQIAEDADESYQRLLELEETITDINSTGVPAFLSIFYRTDLLELDIKTSLTEAINERSSAADDLVTNYNTAITTMEKSIDDTEFLKDFQDWKNIVSIGQFLSPSPQ